MIPPQTHTVQYGSPPRGRYFVRDEATMRSVYSGDSKSDVIAEAERRNGWPVTGSEAGYAASLEESKTGAPLPDDPDINPTPEVDRGRNAREDAGSEPLQPAIQIGTEDEARALRIAVTYALRQGVATDGLDGGEATNESLVSIGRKLGCTIPAWCEEEL